MPAINASDRDLILSATHRMMCADCANTTPRTFTRTLWAINTLMRGERVPEVVESARETLREVTA